MRKKTEGARDRNRNTDIRPLRAEGELGAFPLRPQVSALVRVLGEVA